MKYNILSLKIKKYRLDIGLTQEELAQKTQLSLGALKTYEIGTRLPSKKAKIKLCDFFHINLEDLEGEKEKNELKTYLISIIDNYKLDSKKFTLVRKTIYDFWEQCFTLYEINRFNIDSILKCFSIEHKKTSAEYVRIDRNTLNTLNQDTEILDIAEEILNSTIMFFYKFIMYGKYNEAIFKNSVIEYLSYILLYLCISNYYMITQALKEINVDSQVTQYLIPLISNFSNNLEEHISHCNNFIELPISMKKKNTKYIAIKIDNDENSLKYEKGDIVVIKLQHKTIKLPNNSFNAKDVLVSISNQPPVIRRIVNVEGGAILTPLNSTFLFQNKSNLEMKAKTLNILGIVVQVIINNNI